MYSFGQLTLTHHWRKKWTQNMGRNKGIAWTYDNRNQLHPADFEEEYAKVEPYVSLNPSEVLVEERVKAEFESRLERLERQIQEYASK